ncbi:MAG TPA: hypothetical protein VGB62_03995 [Allosphingosinicella sp.]|jgi:hypothetical protein
MEFLKGSIEYCMKLPWWFQAASFLPFLLVTGVWPKLGGLIFLGLLGLFVVSTPLTMGMLLVITAPVMAFATFGTLLGLILHYLWKLIA